MTYNNIAHDEDKISLEDAVKYIEIQLGFKELLLEYAGAGRISPKIKEMDKLEISVYKRILPILQQACQ